MSNESTKYPPGPTYKMSGKLIRQFIHDPIKTLSTISQKYGDISYFKLGPKQHVYLINNPDYIEKVLIYDHRNFKKGKRLQAAKALLGEGLVTSEGDFHNRQRRLIQPTNISFKRGLWHMERTLRRTHKQKPIVLEFANFQ